MPPLCLVHGTRVVPLEVGPTTRLTFADPRERRDLGGRRVAVTVRADRVEIEDESGDGVSVRGERKRRHVVGPGEAVAVGRQRVLIAESVGSGARSAVLWNGMIAAEPCSLEALCELARVGPARAPVWIAGESGTGKELAARAIHETSGRAGRPFVAVNCAALPDNLLEAELFGVERGAFTGATRTRAGAFQRAAGGTLLLDELGELPPSAQAKILRALETQEVQPVGAERTIKVDVRVIAASWRDLEHEVEAGRFRLDLLHRLWVLKVELPPLRARTGDIAPLIDHLLRLEGAPDLAPSAAMIERLARHTWPGNIRELRNCVARAVAAEDPSALAPQVRREARPVDGTQHPRVELAHQALDRHLGNRTRSAASLGVSRSTFYRWLDASRGPAPRDVVPASMTSAR
ncbi:MAG: sigma-54-dependent Fis family transcriptional regulator [Deltaproteobacteria bacterium]|nr:sigma-54-dependent Fis family transcriptional regulator [Deltaproteobacteria bacterium]